MSQLKILFKIERTIKCRADNTKPKLTQYRCLALIQYSSYYYYFISFYMLFTWRTYYWSVYFVHDKCDGYIVNFSHDRHILNCWLIEKRRYIPVTFQIIVSICSLVIAIKSKNNTIFSRKSFVILLTTPLP